MVSLKTNYHGEIKNNYQVWESMNAGKLEAFVLQEQFAGLRTGILRTQNNYGVKRLPLYSEMRGIMTAFDTRMLESSLHPSRGVSGPDLVYSLIVTKMFAIGLEPRLAISQISTDEINKVKEIYVRFQEKSNWKGLAQVRDKICNFMKNKKAVQNTLQKPQMPANPMPGKVQLSQSALQNALKVVKMFELNCAICQEECQASEDTGTLEEKEQGEQGIQKDDEDSDDSILSDLSEQLNSVKEEQEKKQEVKERADQEEKAKGILDRLVGAKKLIQNGKPYGYGCFVGSHNFIQKSRLRKVKQHLKDKFKEAEWNLNQGYFYINVSNLYFHYGCVKPLSNLDQREFSSGIIPSVEFNCILPVNSYSPDLEEYSKRNLQTQVYQNAHSAFQFIATVVQHYQLMRSEGDLIDQRICLDIQAIKNILSQLPDIISTFIADNAILNTRLNGLKEFISTELKCSVTKALVDNLKSVFDLFGKPIQEELDKLPLECKSLADLTRYGEKLERYVANLVIRSQSYDEKAKGNLRLLFKTFAQFLMEAKNIEQGLDGQDIQLFQLLPLLEASAGMVVGRYAIKIKEDDLKTQLQSFETEKRFYYLWQSVLELQEIQIAEISAVAGYGLSQSPIIVQIEVYESSPGLRAMILSMSEEAFQLPIIKLPKSFLSLQTQFISKPCKNCQKVPDKSAICCFCGEVVCLMTDCCKRGGSLDEAFFHSRQCSFGTGLFIALESGMFRLDVISSRMFRRGILSPYLSSGGMRPGSLPGTFELSEEELEKAKRFTKEMKINMIS